MTAPVLHPDDALLQAASLAFAVVRFADGAAHTPRGAKPPGVPRLGDEVYIFAPSSRRVLREDVPTFLAALPSPAMLFPTTTRGLVALQLLTELSGDRAEGAQKEFVNQRGNLEDMVRQLGLTAEAPVLLEFSDEVHVFSLAVLLLWSERFAVCVGWNIGPLRGDPRASARLHLFRSDGVNS